MRIAYFPNQTAIDSVPVWKAFLESCVNRGLTPVENIEDADTAVIWSMLWQGRMSSNRRIWEKYRKQNKPVIVLEIGALDRGNLWKVGVNGVNGLGYFGPTGMDNTRRKKLGINPNPWKKKNEIVICTQHASSCQWEKMIPIDQWVTNVVKELRNHTDRPIKIRTHPRYPIRMNLTLQKVIIENARSVVGISDSINFKNSISDAWAVINWNSNPGVISALHGVPVFVSTESLAAPVGNLNFGEIENPITPDREQWANDLAYTEWTVDEIRRGEPLDRLISILTSKR